MERTESMQEMGQILVDLKNPNQANGEACHKIKDHWANFSRNIFAKGHQSMVISSLLNSQVSGYTAF